MCYATDSIILKYEVLKRRVTIKEWGKDVVPHPAVLRDLLLPGFPQGALLEVTGGTMGRWQESNMVPIWDLDGTLNHCRPLLPTPNSTDWCKQGLCYYLWW